MHKTYKNMITRMVQKETAQPTIKEAWHLYILRCCDGTFYTGITKDLQKRLKKHNDGKASRYTRTRRPVELLYQEACLTRGQALVRECEVKALPRTQKEKLLCNGHKDT